MRKLLRKYFKDDRTEELKGSKKLSDTITGIKKAENSIYDTRAISLIANIISKSNIKAYRMTGGLPVEVESGAEILELIGNPSPGKNLGDLLSSFVKDILIHNRWWVYYDEEINALLPLDPTVVSYDLQNGIIDKVRVGTKTLETEAIIVAQNNATEEQWIKTQKNVSGSAKNKDLDVLYKIESDARTYAQSKLVNNYSISGLITTDNPDRVLSQAERDEIDTELSKRYSGSSKAGRPFFSPGLKFTQTGDTNSAQEYRDYIEIVKREILSYRGIPLLLLENTPNSTSYSSRQELSNLYESVINPMLLLFTETLNIQLAPSIDEDILLDFTDETPIDIQQLQQTLQPLYESGLASLNEVRVPLGLPEVSNGDKLMNSRGEEISIKSKKPTRNIIEEMKTKERAERLNKTIVKQRKIQREIKKIKESVYDSNT